MCEMQSVIECQGLALTANSPQFGNSEPNQTPSRNHCVINEKLQPPGTDVIKICVNVGL